MSIGSILIYGASGVGKTVSVHRVFKKALVLQTDRDAHDSVLVDQGYIPASLQLPYAHKPGELFQEVNGMVDVVNREVAAGKFTSVVIDSGSDLADRLLMDYLTNITEDRRKAYPAVEMQIKMILDKLWLPDRWLICICQEEEPGAHSTGTFYKGGPKFPGRNLASIVQYKFSVVVRAKFEQMSGERKLCCDPAEMSWYFKDRFGLLQKEQALDLNPLVQGILKLKGNVA